jgi:hypothetical protein
MSPFAAINKLRGTATYRFSEPPPFALLVHFFLNIAQLPTFVLKCGRIFPAEQ